LIVFGAHSFAKVLEGGFVEERGPLCHQSGESAETEAEVFREGILVGEGGRDYGLGRVVVGGVDSR